MEHFSKSMIAKQLHRKASFKEPEGSVKDDESSRVLLKTSTASFQCCGASFATASFLKACTIKGMFGIHLNKNFVIHSVQMFLQQIFDSK